MTPELRDPVRFMRQCAPLECGGLSGTGTDEHDAVGRCRRKDIRIAPGETIGWPLDDYETKRIRACRTSSDDDLVPYFEGIRSHAGFGQVVRAFPFDTPTLNGSVCVRSVHLDQRTRVLKLEIHNLAFD